MSEDLKQLAIRSALELGAGAVRVTDARSDDESRRRMQAAFERKDFACWDFDTDYARRASDPEELFAGAKSVVCIALAYSTPPPREAAPLRGRVSNYAWSEDYHRRLRLLLDSVARRIDEAAGGPVTYVACDTRPLAERAFAARAGLGWVGKHTNLIAPGLGSFVFLGEIVTTIALAADEPLAKSCGSCVRCVAACPTQALRGDYTIDANRCISDLTQRTDRVPPEMRPFVGEWVWGCDICQLVCPPTSEAGHCSDPSAVPLDRESGRPGLTELLRLRSGDFRRRYRATAMGWRGAAVLRRNAAVALGNVLDRATVGPLIESLNGDPHPMVRGHVAWALGRIGSPAALVALQHRLDVEGDEEVRHEIAAALSPFSRPYAESAKEEE